MVTRRLLLALRFGLDLGVLSLAYWVGWLARFDGAIPLQYFKQAAFGWPYVVAAQLFGLWLFGVPRLSWRHVSLLDLKRVAAALGLVAAVMGALRLVGPSWSAAFPHARYLILPLGVIAFQLVFGVAGVLGLRILRRLYSQAPVPNVRERHPVLLVGAGAGGVALARELLNRDELGRWPVAFLDDDPLKQNEYVLGLPVVGPISSLAEHARELGIEEVLIAAPTLPGAKVREVHTLASRLAIPARTIPSLAEIVSGQVGISRIRDVSVEDLLRRPSVNLRDEGFVDLIRGRRVAITGAGGSIGSELVRQIAGAGPSDLILIERAENPLFYLLAGLRVVGGTRVAPYVADVCDPRRMGAIFAAERPQVVLHAAAHKHVPLMEAAPSEAVRNNLGGTRLIADLSLEHEADVFVLVSTDKAVNPSSVMGATKRAAERYAESRGRLGSATRFVTVRFGNVLGSNGSVVTVFREQIARGGPVTVTHADMVRYFMTIPEASRLILRAAALGRGEGAELFLLDMGEPVRILDLAQDMIRLSGLEPGQDVAIEFCGLRPGEKLFEELYSQDETVNPHPDAAQILVVAAQTEPLRADALEALLAAAESADQDATRARLHEVVPEWVEQAADSPQASGAD